MSDRIREIKERLSATTQGKWVYDSNRDKHDSCVYVDGSKDKHGYIGPDNGGVVGCSEWIWITDEDGEFIAHSKDDIEWLIGEVERLRRARVSPLQDTLDSELQVANAAAQMLEMDDADKLGMLVDICDARGIDPSFLPGRDTRQGKGINDVDLECGCNESIPQNASNPDDPWFPDELVK